MIFIIKSPRFLSESITYFEKIYKKGNEGNDRQ